MQQNVEKEALIKALKTVSEDPDFILSVLVHVRDKADRQAMTEYILSDKKPTYEDILLTALEIYDQRNEE